MSKQLVVWEFISVDMRDLKKVNVRVGAYVGADQRHSWFVSNDSKVIIFDIQLQ